MQLSKQRTSFDVRKFSFSQRVVQSGTSYLKMLWMLHLRISSRTDRTSSGKDIGIKSLA